MITVLLADDEPMVLAGVRTLLATDAEIEVVAEATDGQQAVDLVRATRPDVALLDIRMPRLDGIAAAAAIARQSPRVAVAILTTFGEESHVNAALNSGARGFLLKSADPRELITGVHALAAGGAFLSPEIAARMIQRLRESGLGRAAAAQAQAARLSEREREVLTLLGAGLANAQIARRLNVVEGTVKGHVSAILTELGMTNRVQAAVLAHEAGLLRNEQM